MSENSSEVSPLKEASPESLADLFNKDPRKLSDENVERIVEYFRQGRATWEAEEAKPKAAKKIAAPAGLDLSALGLTGPLAFPVKK